MSVRYVPIVEVELSDPTGISFARNAGIDIQFAEPGDPRIIILSTLDWLCGNNSWGLHNSVYFAQPNSAVLTGIRVMQAAEQARDEGRGHVPLAEGDYQKVKEAAETPQPHPHVSPQPACVARAILPIINAIKGASTDVPEDWQEKRANGAEAAKTAVESK